MLKVKDITPVTAIGPDRMDWVFSGDKHDDEARGCVGHLRGDFGRDGDEFWTTWWDHLPELKTQSFRDEFQVVVNTLRKGILRDYKAMNRMLRNGRPCGRGEYAFEFETPDYLYCLRCIPRRSDYNFYLYAYDKAIMNPEVI